MYYEEVFRALHEAKVRYLVVGGIAVNLHGIPRLTMDLDIIVDLADENVTRLVKMLEKLGYRPRQPVKLSDFGDPETRRKWIEEKNMLALLLEQPEVPYDKIDILVQPQLEFAEAYARRERVSLMGVEIPLLSLDDLILMKGRAGRMQDQSDVEALEKLREIKKP